MSHGPSAVAELLVWPMVTGQLKLWHFADTIKFPDISNFSRQMVIWTNTKKISGKKLLLAQNFNASTNHLIGFGKIFMHHIFYSCTIKWFNSCSKSILAIWGQKTNNNNHNEQTCTTQYKVLLNATSGSRTRNPLSAKHCHSQRYDSEDCMLRQLH